MEQKTRRQIVVNRKQGMTLEEIANINVMSISNVRRIIYEDAPELVRKYDTFDEDRQKAIAHDYYDLGYSLKQIREKYHVDDKYMQTIRNKYKTCDKRRKEYRK